MLHAAICTQDCENGGTCVAPETCSCRETYGGPICRDRKLSLQHDVLYLHAKSDVLHVLLKLNHY